MPASRTVAIVGRPNVGKSALFNRLAGKKISIVHDQPGVTRDRLSAICRMGKEPFSIFDTGGIGAADDAEFHEQVRIEADIAIESSDVILFVVDAQSGLTPLDEELAQQLRRSPKPLVLVVNKMDHDKHQSLDLDFARLGFDRILPISAEHARGILDLVQQIEDLLPSGGTEEEKPAPLAIAIVGRPNVGKSSIINALLHGQRTLVSPISGTTRDAVDIPYSRDGRDYLLIDTAGIRARGKQDNSVEIFSVMRSEKSILRADLCVLVIDATEKVTAQDKKIAGLIQKAAKPCVVAVNKWDLVKSETPEKGDVQDFLNDIRANLFFVDYANIILTCAKTGESVGRLFNGIEHTRAASKERIGTGLLNRVVQDALTATPTPSRAGKRFKILYATQVETPASQLVPVPTFLFFVNDPESLAPTYQKYLESRLRAQTPFTGLPLIFRFRGREKRGRKKYRGR
jgi:GTP-binding protein